jgi:WXG100 family type VII secretion target
MANADEASAAPGTLAVDPAALRAAQSQLNNIATALMEKLRTTGTHVDDLLEVWHGGAAVKWSEGWTESHDYAIELFNILGAVSDALGESAAGYEQQESASGENLADVQQAIKINW